ncbi:MAG TPA: helix-turn-helix transcriptional regulator [Bacteroidales bacterium]|mgnify:CR=1 FL=1|nr:helix-turn-helix transcriptional regulator [Bacteroidales bacterium]HPJ55338.1 helix-turn-helix transcriptional regulator [Bacteroidales bacterium]HPQ56421.1 helix-turn-helix transcriptional regulator [Bacteroidales bacterium]
MKVKDVPQDDEFLQPDGDVLLRDRTYALDDDGKYREIPSAGWAPKNEAIRFSWSNNGEKAKEVLKEVLSGKCSPLKYHMIRLVMTPGILADYTGMSKRKINKLCKPKHFASIKPEELSSIADAMNISVEELTSID